MLRWIEGQIDHTADRKAEPMMNGVQSIAYLNNLKKLVAIWKQHPSFQTRALEAESKAAKVADNLNDIMASDAVLKATGENSPADFISKTFHDALDKMATKPHDPFFEPNLIQAFQQGRDFLIGGDQSRVPKIGNGMLQCWKKLKPLIHADAGSRELLIQHTEVLTAMINLMEHEQQSVSQTDLQKHTHLKKQVISWLKASSKYSSSNPSCKDFIDGITVVADTYLVKYDELASTKIDAVFKQFDKKITTYEEIQSGLGKGKESWKAKFAEDTVIDTVLASEATKRTGGPGVSKAR